MWDLHGEMTERVQISMRVSPKLVADIERAHRRVRLRKSPMFKNMSRNTFLQHVISLGLEHVSDALANPGE
jgi:hypothetical protein